MILSGKNLGERQKDLNAKVNDAVAQEINFDLIKEQEEVSDADVLFKIDVAAKYKNVEYILEILKSEDSLHITRALKKCDWLFHNEHSHIINIYYLHNNLFPHMSQKMKRKMLTTISTHVRDENQAETFYNYCLAEKLKNVAGKFLLRTSEAFKLSYVEKWDNYERLFSHKVNLKNFLGNSFALAEAYLKNANKYMRDDILGFISYLYNESNDKYLDLLERYTIKFSYGRLSIKVTKDIAKKHKNRVLAKLEIYLQKLHLKTLVKHSNLEEIKKYATITLSENSDRFWRAKHWKTSKMFLNAIPAEEKFEFVKDIYTKNNPGVNFETSDEFWTKGYYNLMTKKQKVEATKNYENEQGNISRIKRNIWYKNVQFDEAFSIFKEKMTNNKNRKMRTNLLIVLIKASKLQKNLLKVLKYYQGIFHKEKVADKEKLLNAIFHFHNVFNLNSNCWTVLQKMLLDEEVSRIRSWPEKKYESIVYLYHILHKKNFPSDHKMFFDTTELSSFNAGLKKMNKKQRTRAIEYLYQYHVKRLYELDDTTDYEFNKELEKRIHKHVHKVINLVKGMDKTKDDIPEIAQKYILSAWEEFNFYEELKDDQNNFMKRLKQDASTVQHFRTIKANLEDNHNIDFKLVPVLRKIKIYFSHDIAERFVDFFKYCLSERNLETFDEYGYSNQYRVVDTAIIGINMLAKDSYKEEIMFHFKPTSDIIDDEEIDDVYLNIQSAICSFGYFSRPPMPFSRLSIYLKGDYARRCLPTIGSLFANLPTSSCVQLAETLLSTPRSMLKYSFHLVFHRLSIDELQEVVINVLKNTNHDSVRRDLFALMYRATLSHNKIKQEKLVKCFKEMASSVPEYDLMCYFTLKKMSISMYAKSSIKHELLEAYQTRTPEGGM